MTDEEKREAAQTVNDLVNEFYTSNELFNLKLMIEFGYNLYDAGRESMRKESDSSARACAKAIEHLNVERERSAKLIKGIRGAIENWGVDLIIEEIKEAIAEYEAKHD